MIELEFKFPNQSTWEKLILRWSDFPLCGEKKLIAAVIAQAIIDDKKDHALNSVADRSGFFAKGLKSYCRLINLNSDFIIEQVLLAASRDGEMVEIAA